MREKHDVQINEYKNIEINIRHFKEKNDDFEEKEKHYEHEIKELKVKIHKLEKDLEEARKDDKKDDA